MPELNQVYKIKNRKNLMPFQYRIRYKLTRMDDKKVYIESIEKEGDYICHYEMTFKQFEKYLELA